jgi:putative ABC transport system permease protein
MADALRAIEAKWREVFPDEPFVYAFMDQELARLYKNEIRLKKASSVATGLMLLIVFTGVFGMVSLVISKRTKEMGIRKVLGASIRDIVLLVSKPYFVLIIVSFAITAPLAYYASVRWLSSFAYKVALPWWIFVVPVVITLALTGILVGAKSIRAAMRNPVRALRYE